MGSLLESVSASIGVADGAGSMVMSDIRSGTLGALVVGGLTL